jgi:pimeloyl-ACP methyl ester carboxylesterase
VPRLSRFVALSACAAIALCACQSTPPPTATPGRSAAPSAASAGAFRPSFDAAPCPDDVTNEVLTPATCGFLTVLEDRSKPDGRTIQLFVARLDPPGGTTTVDPVINLGDLASLDDYAGMSPVAQRTHRVLYLLDPRGIGHSTPALDCPEVPAVGPELAGFRLRDPARRTILLDAVAACHDRLVGQGIDLAAYDIAANANDLEDLRTTLGIASWNLMTDGSASRLAFEVARRFPQGLRSLIIDSPSLPTPDFLTIGPAALDLAISRIVAACAAQPACEGAYPDLDAMIRTAVAQLDARPLTFDVTGTVTAIQLGRPIPVVVDGAALLRWIRWSLGSQGGKGSAPVPATVRSVLDGKLSATDGAVINLASDVGDCLGLLGMSTSCEEPNIGALYSIVCRDVAGQIDQSRLDASIDARPAYADVFSPSPLLAPCDAWGVEPSGPGPQGSITGGIPMLVLRGAFDPFSAPPSEVSEATTGLDNVYVLDIPNQSYNVLGWTECPRSIRNAWIDAPNAPPADTSCLATIPTIEFGT